MRDATIGIDTLNSLQQKVFLTGELPTPRKQDRITEPTLLEGFCTWYDRHHVMSLRKTIESVSVLEWSILTHPYSTCADALTTSKAYYVSTPQASTKIDKGHN